MFLLPEVCNLFENTNVSEFCLYISEWAYGTQQVSNIRATTKVVVHCLLSSCPKLQELGTALTYNLGIKEVKTVVKYPSFELLSLFYIHL
jgi:hypothetical protein